MTHFGAVHAQPEDLVSLRLAVGKSCRSPADSAISSAGGVSAISSNQAYIVGPNTNYQLLYGSVQPSGTPDVSFAVSEDGETYQLSADCNAGLIVGQKPQSAAEAERLNVACQVPFGNA